MEKWDAYDKNLNIIPNVDLIRDETIPDGMFHLVGEIMVRHIDGTYLIMQRDYNKHYGGKWEFSSGGSALKGETPLECAKRELKEETGITSNDFKEITRVINENHRSFYVIFLCITDCKKDSISLQDGETIDYKWITKEDLLNMSSTEMISYRTIKLLKESYMNKEWANLCKEFQSLIAKKNTFDEGVLKLLELRKNIYDTVMLVYREFPIEGYSKQPFVNKDSYDSKTMAYSIYHIARIEDIVLSRLLMNCDEIFNKENYKEKMNSSIITTGNELHGSEIEGFSKPLNIEELMNYFTDVYNTSNEYLKNIKYENLKTKFNDNKREEILQSGSVDSSEDAVWLIDYWCSKDTLGLLKMPFSRHWIMHVEAFLRIKNKIKC